MGVDVAQVQSNAWLYLTSTSFTYVLPDSLGDYGHVGQIWAKTEVDDWMFELVFDCYIGRITATPLVDTEGLDPYDSAYTTELDAMATEFAAIVDEYTTPDVVRQRPMIPSPPHP